MADFEINKGVGREVEFKGLRAQYLFIFAAGLLAVFVMFVIMYMAGIGQWICIGFGVSSATVLVWLTFTLNRKYGKQVSHHGGGTRLHRQQGRRHHGRFPGHTAGSVFGIIRRI